MCAMVSIRIPDPDPNKNPKDMFFKLFVLLVFFSKSR